MSLGKCTPCDYGECPYDAEYYSTCEYYCSEPEPEDIPDIDEDSLECGFDPYLGCYTDDC